jgi:hemoglobin
MADLSELDDPGLRRLVDAFYARVRADPLIGPVFNDAVQDWPHHLALLGDF